jgi:hypothetical protein
MEDQTTYGTAPSASSYPVDLLVRYPESSSRALAALSIPFFLARGILLLPVLFCLYFVSIAALFVVWFAFWAVAFTGRYPRGMFDFVTGFLRWQIRATAYLYGLTDSYPPFRLSS